ncbi:hypothetical protein ACNOYE_34055 [Nannocystaceae bacterium ST9]
MSQGDGTEREKPEAARFGLARNTVMNRRTTLALLFALATVFVPQAARAEFAPGMDALAELGTVHGIEREGDIPLP